MAALDLLAQVCPLERHTRDPAVEAQIAAVLQLPPQKLIQRAGIRERTSTEFLREETLAYLVRAYWAAGDQNVVLMLTSALFNRHARAITGRFRARGLNVTQAEDAYVDVVRVVVMAITDLESARGDFYQVRFARALKYRMLTVYDGYLQKIKDAPQQVRISETSGSIVGNSEDGDLERATFRAELIAPLGADDDLLDAETRALRYAHIGLVLGAIQDPRHREAFVLRYLEGWQITADNPEEPCLVRHFGKIPKTIYNWLARADADIAAAALTVWREEE